ncbi:sugar ABC transporter permease [Massilia sp. MB5]|uniref:carbohydrate ABC transporter permease n=1 Tax=unclassified Massilia TaxID=2609279 RepID=UPI00067B2432|nr:MULTISPECIES: sugar ABC transporter permease [unclassified Massilia]AKU23133.1 ABC transporter permease [Massilia sp. NR 4-1]UMR31963.1 sugar ABC transporter permease [Massilia sp. MB5]
MTSTRKPWLLIAPSLALALFIIGYPVFHMAYQSLHEISRFGVVRGFAGLGNFTGIFIDPVFHATLLRTLIWTVAVVGGSLLISMPLALILNQDFHGRSLARTIIMLPWAVSLTMTAIVWRWAFNDEFGMVNLSLQALGVIDRPVQWLASAALAFPAEILVGIMVSMPFTVTLLLGGLSSVPQDIYEAARMEGATAWQQFRLLTVPSLRPFINMAVVLNVIYVFNSFPIIWVMTQGGPSNSTHILVTYLYELGFRLGRPGQAAAISLIMLAILLAFTWLYIRMQPKEEAA